MKPVQTSEQYVQGGGKACPVCGSADGIEGGEINIDAGGASQEIYCSLCESAWTDVYALVAYENLEVGE